MRTDLVFKGSNLGIENTNKRAQTRITLEEMEDKKPSRNSVPGGITIIKSQLGEEST